MKKYVKAWMKTTYACKFFSGMGTNGAFSQGFKKVDIEQGYDDE